MSKENILKKLEENICAEKFRDVTKKQNRITSIMKNTFATIICVFSISGFVFAKDISTKIYENKYSTGNGIGKAIEEGYISNTETEYENSNTKVQNRDTEEIIEGIDINIKVKEFLMDDFNLSLTFDIEFDNKVNETILVNEIREISFPDLIIYDENNVVLYHMLGSSLDNFCKENSLNFNSETATNEQVIGSGVNSFPVMKEGNKIGLIYNIYTGGNQVYPKSKNLKLKIGQVNISREDATFPGDGEITFTGNWNIDLNVPEKMYNRTSEVYVQKSTTNKDFKVLQAVLYDTGMKIKFEGTTSEEVKHPKYPQILEQEFFWQLSDEDEIKTREIQSYLEYKNKNTDEYKKFLEEEKLMFERNMNFKPYLTNSNNQKFELTQGPSENGSIDFNENGKIKFEGMFDLTKYDETNEIVLHIEDNGNIVEITLVKKEAK